MSKSIVSVVKYEEPLESVRKVIEQSKLFEQSIITKIVETGG